MKYSLITYEGNKKTTYYARGTVNGKRVKINIGHDLGLALQKLRELENEPDCNEIQTLADIWDIYKKDKLMGFLILKPSSQAKYDHYWKHIGPAFEGIKLHDICSSHIRQYIKQRARTIAGRSDKKIEPNKTHPGSATANREKSLISTLFVYAINELEIDNLSNPCASVKPFKEYKRGRYVEKWEYERIFAQATPLLQDFMDLCLFMGQRPADIIDLTMEDFIRNVDLTATYFHDGQLVSEIADKKIGTFVKVQTNKTAQKIRIFVEGPLENVVNRVLNKRREDIISSMYFLYNKKGDKLQYRTLYDWFRKALKAAGFNCGDVQLRDLRIKNANDDTADNANKRLGHKNMATTDRYRDTGRGNVVRPMLKLI